MTNVELLQRKIKDSGYKVQFIAEKMGLSRAGLYKKLNGQNEFLTSEVESLCEILGIDSLEERQEIFFAKTVD